MQNICGESLISPLIVRLLGWRPFYHAGMDGGEFFNGLLGAGT